MQVSTCFKLFKIMRTSVAIVGAGPTGLTLALALANYGIDFKLIDSKAVISPLSKALGIQARTLELLEDLGAVSPFLEQGKANGKINLFVSGKKKGGFDLSAIGEGFSAYPYMLTLPQNQTEEILAQKVEELGQKIHWSTALVALEQNTQGVHLQLKNPEGELEHLQADYLVGCDGARSKVRHELELPFEGGTDSRYFYVVDTQIIWEGTQDTADMYNCFCKNSFVAIIRMPGTDRFRIIGIMPKEFDNPASTTQADIVHQIKTDSELDIELVDISWHAVYKVHTRKAPSFQQGRCFIAGDAAHVHTPAGGQGMNTGIQDAYNLAWKLAMVCKGQAAPSLLDTYNEEREKNARQLLVGTDRAFNIQSGDGAFIRFIRLHVFPSIAGFLSNRDMFKKKLFPIFSQINIKYPESSLTQTSKHGKVQAGDRLPYFELPQGGKIYDLIQGGQFHLLCAQAPSISLPDYVKVVPFRDFSKKLFGNSEGLLVLVRPDNHVAYIGKEEKELESYFKKEAFAQLV